jgi:hypothetical protein
LFSKLINVAVPKTIDERAINLNLSKQDIFREGENLELGRKFLCIYLSDDYMIPFFS